MKNTNTCSKCQSNDVVYVKGRTGSYGMGNVIMLRAFSPINVSSYICLNCGFLEEYIEPKDLEKVKKLKKSGKI